MNLDDIIKNIPLEIRIKTRLMMDDVDNWEGGEYLGDRNKLVPSIMEEIKDWFNDLI